MQGASTVDRQVQLDAFLPLCAAVLGLNHVTGDDNFFDLGGDSVLSVRLIATAARAGIDLTPRMVFETRSLAELAGRARLAAVSTRAQRTTPDPLPEHAPLTPPQQLFLHIGLSNPDAFTTEVLLELVSRPTRSDVFRSLRLLRSRYDSLRIRLVERQGELMQTFDDDQEFITTHDHSGMSPEAEQAVLARLRSDVRAQIRLREGPVVRAAFIERTSQAPQLLLVVHHVSVDEWSWKVLVNDLAELMRSHSLQETPTSYARWSQQLQRAARRPDARAEQAFWLGRPWSEAVAIPADLDGDDGSRQRGLVVELESEVVARIEHGISRGSIHHVLLGALAEASTRRFGGRVVPLRLTWHGRDALASACDVSRSVGWFNSMFPFAVDLGHGERTAARVQVAARQFESIPLGGLGYGIFRFMSPTHRTRAAFDALPYRTIPLSFNYVRNSASDAEPNGDVLRIVDQRSYQLPRRWHVRVLAMHSGSGLSINWAYSIGTYLPSTIEALAQEHLCVLRELA